MTDPLASALERLRVGARGVETPGGDGAAAFVALYADHCKALLDEIKRLEDDLADEGKWL